MNNSLATLLQYEKKWVLLWFFNDPWLLLEKMVLLASLPDMKTLQCKVSRPRSFRASSQKHLENL